MAVELNDIVRKRLEGAEYWHLATISADGSPNSSPMWLDLREGKILINTAAAHAKNSSLRKNPNIALSHTAADNPFDHVQIRGKVVEVIDGGTAEQDIDALTKKYTGQDEYGWRAPGETRVTFLIEPTYVRHFVPG